MPLEHKKTTLVASGSITVEEAETILEWLQQHPRGKLNLSACTHLHSASLQVLMAAHAKISVWPKQPSLSNWLQIALNQEEHAHV